MCESGSRLAGGPLGVTGLCRAAPAASAGAKAGPHPASPARGGGRVARRRASPRGRGSVAVIRASFQAKDGTGCPCFARVSRVRACGAAGAYRGGAVRARDCPRETAHAPRPSVPAGVFFAAPASRFLQKRRKAAPGEPPLSTFILHHLGESQAQQGTKNENGGDFSWNAGGAGAGGPARQNWRTKLSSPRLRS